VFRVQGLGIGGAVLADDLSGRGLLGFAKHIDNVDLGGEIQRLFCKSPMETSNNYVALLPNLFFEKLGICK
jgi:hypothetical protein